MTAALNGEVSPRRRRVLVAALIAGSVALSLPLILGDFWLDDWQYQTTEFNQPDAPFSYYDVMQRTWMDSENAHWWAPPGIKLKFFRPLASLSLYLDLGLLRAGPLLAHLQTVLWFIVLLLGAERLLRRLLPARAALWAMAIFSLANMQIVTAGWISARCGVMAGAFSIWAVLLYLAWREGGGKLLLALSLLLQLLGLLSYEGAAAIAPFLLAYELLGRGEALRRRLLAVAPVLGLVAAYVVVYVALGYGATSSAIYVNPTEEPLRYLLDIVPKALGFLSNLSLGMPTIMWIVPLLRPFFVIMGLLGGALLLGALYRARGQLLPEQGRLLRWLGLALLLAMLPGLSSVALYGQQFVLAGIAFAALAGLAISGLRAMPKSWPGRLLVGALCLGTLCLSPLLRLGLSASFAADGAKQARLGRDSQLDCTPGSQVFLVNANFHTGLYAPFILAKYHGYAYRRWRVLVQPMADVTLARSGPDQLTVSSEQPLVPPDHAYGADLSDGTVIERVELKATVLDRVRDGPSKIAFEIPALADPARTCLVFHDAGVLKRLPVPAVGESVGVKMVPIQ